MSYSYQDAKMERRVDISISRMKGDFKELYRLAHLEQAEGNVELAEQLYLEAKSIEHEVAAA